MDELLMFADDVFGETPDRVAVRLSSTHIGSQCHSHIGSQCDSRRQAHDGIWD